MLKSLELFGFKSFPDRTTFEFHTGITGVVGPNGSGKSNVVDAIKWILGDQSAKSLRGKEMSDVIFNGTASHKPSNLCEATLTFDNSNGHLPIETAEVTVTRRLWRSGDAEYLINGTTARLKDIRDLFAGTGAGRSTYCIIEQGRVDQILQGNATTRREIFEDAAGISRYKSRRTEALRKLERVEQNLLRLTDIVDELDARLTSIRSQAAKAAKYREISAELREYWMGLAADDYRHHAGQMEEIEQRIEKRQSQIKQLKEQLDDSERNLSGHDNDIAEIDVRIRESERRIATDREAIASHQSTIQHQIARRREFNGELSRLRKQRSLMRVRTWEITDELGETKRQSDRFESDFSQQKQKLDTREKELKELATQIEQKRESLKNLRNQRLERTRDVSAANNQVSRIQSQLDATQTAHQAGGKRVEELDEKMAKAANELERRRKRKTEAQSKISFAQKQIDNIVDDRQQMVGEQGHLGGELASKREQRSAWQARKSVLEDLEARQEGLGIGVKEILARARSADQSPWNRIIGSVADLVEVDLENAAFLEVALGNRAQLIVIEEFEPLIDYLNRGICEISGRVGFLEHARLEGNNKTTSKNQESPTENNRVESFEHFQIHPETLPDLSGQPGVRERADRMAHASQQLPGLAQQLLADTWIVETLDVAIALSSGLGRGCRFVTLQGELLDADGTLSVGSVKSETALVSRKSELRQLKNDLQKLERNIEQEEQQLSRLVDSLSDTDHELQSAKDHHQKLVDRHTQLKSEFESQKQEHDRFQKEEKALADEIHQLLEQKKQLTGDLENAQMEHALNEEELYSLEKSIEQAERDLARSEHRLQLVEQTTTADRLELAKQEERFSGLESACDRLEQERQQRIQQYDEVERRYESIQSKRQQITLHFLNTNAILAELFITEEQFAETVAGLMSTRARFRTRRAELLEGTTKVREQRRDLNEQQHSDEIQIRDVRFQISALQERMEEEFQTTLADVVASGASAFQLHLLRTSTKNNDSTEPPLSSESTSDDDRQAIQTGGPTFLEVRDELEAMVTRLRRKRKLMGSVNTDSLRDLDELEKRFGNLSEQLKDLTEAKAALSDIVRRINTESKRLFLESFGNVRFHFAELFRKTFGGGDGDIVLEDPEDVLECGIDIVARPPGKELKSMSLLSGGEKTLTAFALLLALFRTRPSAYCVLDEVDAALDEANVGRLVALLQEFRQTTQFVMITHRKPSMAIADILYGITMEQSGVSKRLSVRFEEVSDNGEFDVDALNSPNIASTQDGQHKDAA